MDTASVCRARLADMNQVGFTLIELMITLVIVSMLVTLAHASYHGAVQRSRRADVQRTLVELQLKQQQYYRQHAHYASSVDQLGYQANLANAYYQLTLSVNAAYERPHWFVLSATALPGSSQLTDGHCRTLSVTDTGQRTPVLGCW